MSLRTLLVLALLCLASPGCMLWRTGDLSAVRPTSDQPRAGSVYLVRGWLGPFSTGMDSLSEELRKQGIRSVVYQDAQARSLARTLVEAYRDERDHEPIILVGHSYGADDVVMISRQLHEHGVPVDLLVTLDPVVPGRVPPNVRKAVNFYKSNGPLDNLPWLRGIPLAADPDALPPENLNLRTDRPELDSPSTNHFNIDESNKVQGAIVSLVLNHAPPRHAWAPAAGPSRPAQQAAYRVGPDPSPGPADSASARPFPRRSENAY